MKIRFSEITIPNNGTVIIGIGDDMSLSPFAMQIDDAMSGALTKAIEANPRFKGSIGSSLILNTPIGLELTRIIFLGLGALSEITEIQMQAFGGKLVPLLNRLGESKAYIAMEDISSCSLSTTSIASEVAFGARLGAYRFSKYQTKLKDDQKPSLKELIVLSNSSEAIQEVFDSRDAVADGIYLARDLVSEPSNVKYPASIVEDIKALEKLGIKVDVLTEKTMIDLGMGALLGVGQGSRRESFMVVMQWDGSTNKNDSPLAFVGKGVTFDTGGISIKPAGGMEEMKYDMAGAAAVIGLMKALAGRKAKVNAVGVVGLVENMPDGNAQRPGDVVTTMSGQTIEVINTDAEGRLVLSDALWYTQDTFKPRFMIDLATLTGAVIVSLGTYQAGLFSNNDELADQLINAGTSSGEAVWRLPLGERYNKDINSDIADMKNVGKGREAGSITAAQLLERFVNDTSWAHLDIAGMAWEKRSDNPIVPKGAAGFGVRLLNQLVADYYEED